MPKRATDYNQTELYIEKAIERNIMHRDYFAHYLRWDYILKRLKPGMNVVDVGCGSGDLAMAMYANKYSPNLYQGFDVSPTAIAKAKKRIEKHNFVFDRLDACLEALAPLVFAQPDVVTCLEVIEHIGHENIDNILGNISDIMIADTTLYISTPNYDAEVGAAGNHMIKGQVGEWTYKDLKAVLQDYFKIEDVYGTFASIKDYKDRLTPEVLAVFEKARKYLGTNMLSVFMASLVPPQYCRNCMWVLKKKGA